MRGTPTKIQTPQDMQNLFALWQQGYEGIDKEHLIEMINALCAQRFFHVPIVNINGNVVIAKLNAECDSLQEIHAATCKRIDEKGGRFAKSDIEMENKHFFEKWHPLRGKIHGLNIALNIIKANAE